MEAEFQGNSSSSENESEDDSNLSEREPGFGVRAPVELSLANHEVSTAENRTKESQSNAAQQKLIKAIPPAIMLSVKALESEDWTSLRAAWKTWKFTLEVASNSQNFSEKAKYSLLVMRGGPLIQEIAMDGEAAKEEVKIGEDDEPVFSNLLKRIEARIAQAANANHDVARLSEAAQKIGESVEAFAKRLRDLAKLCNMDKSSTEMMIRNRLFDGALHGARLAELTLPNPSMTAQEIVDMGTRIEERERNKANKKGNVETIQEKSETSDTLTVGAVERARNSNYKPQGNFKNEDRNFSKNQSWKQHDNRASRQNYGNREFSSRNSDSSYSSNQRFTPYNAQRIPFQTKFTCGRCGMNCQMKRQCFAKDAECYNCGKHGHLARMCQSKSTNENFSSNQKSGKDSSRVNELSNSGMNKVEGQSDNE